MCDDMLFITRIVISAGYQLMGVWYQISKSSVSLVYSVISYIGRDTEYLICVALAPPFTVFNIVSIVEEESCS